MRNCGIVRRLDSLGRVVIPKELRDTFDITEGTQMEIYTDEVGIVIRKYVVKCQFCDESDNLIDFKGKKICKKCYSEIRHGR